MDSRRNVRSLVSGRRWAAAVLVACVVFSTAPPARADSTVYSSSVGLVADGETLLVDTDTGLGLLGYVGAPFQAHVEYSIGWGVYPSGGGTALSFRSAVVNPEYSYFCPDHGTSCFLNGTGLVFAFDTGVLSGVPPAAFRKQIDPAVRDKVNGERPYRGTGGWFTVFTTSDGKTWSEADTNKNRTVTILVVPKPDPEKQIHLRCALTPSRFGEVLLNLDYDIGYVEVLGITGKVGGMYHIDPTSPTLGWARLGGTNLTTSGVTLDRTAGAMTVQLSYPIDGITQVTGQCIKRSTTLSF